MVEQYQSGLSVSSSISAPSTNAIGKRAHKVRTPSCRTAVAAARPTKPSMPTIPTTLALRSCRCQCRQTDGLHGMPSAAAWVSLRLIIASGFANMAISAAAAAMRQQELQTIVVNCLAAVSRPPKA